MIVSLWLGQKYLHPRSVIFLYQKNHEEVNWVILLFPPNLVPCQRIYEYPGVLICVKPSCAQQNKHCLLSMTTSTHTCLQSSISLSAAVIFHTRSWLLMSKCFLQQHFQDPSFTTRTSLVPAPFKQTCPEIQEWGSWDHGDSPRARCKVQGRWHLCLHKGDPGFGTAQRTWTAS